MVLFFASGFSSLIYQVVWTRMLVLVFGATTFATSTVLSVFMGGLALGSFIAGRLTPRIKRPLIWYGALEAIIGVWALVTPSLFASAAPLYKWIWLHTHASLIPFSLLRFATTSLILILPTTCMGATLPLLSKHVTVSLESVGKRVGTLYAVNTLGAVVGAAATGFMLLPSVGIASTIIFAALINFLLLVGVFIIHHISKGTAFGADGAINRAATMEMPGRSETQTGFIAPFARLPRSVVLALIAFAASGAVAMMYEVSWTRSLLMVIGSSTYAFTIMLCAFLIGIFAGSIVCARQIDRFRQPLLCFAVLQFLLAALTLVSMHEFNYVPFWNLLLNSGRHLDENALMGVRLLLAGSVLVPVTLCLGAIFPAVVKGCTSDLESVGRSVGSLYSANTLGAIVGAFIAGFVALPLLGAENTLYAGVVVNALIGALLLWGACSLTRGSKAIITVCSALILVILAVKCGTWDRSIILNAQNERRILQAVGMRAKTFEEWRRQLRENSDIKFWADGACSNVGVIHYKDTNVISLITNGHIDGSDSVDVPVQSLIAGFPLMFKPTADKMCVVGWGCGQTVGTATLFPVKHIDAVELEPQVIAASKYFEHVNQKPLSDPRVHVEINDGRNFLMATDEKFDVIASEPSNPWQAGVCNLFTREYFAICRDRLKDDGILAVWMQTAEVPPGELCAVLGAVNATFNHCVAFSTGTSNLVIIASRQPLKLNVEQVIKYMNNDKIRKEFKRCDIDDVPALIARLAIAGNGIQTLAHVAINTDDLNKLEFEVGKSYENRLYIKENAYLVGALAGDPWQYLEWGAIDKRQKADMLARIGEESVAVGLSPDVAMGWANESIKTLPTARAYKLLGVMCNDKKQYAKAEEALTSALKLDPGNPDLLVLRGGSRVFMNKRAAAREDFEAVLAKRPDDKMTKYLLATSYEPALVGQPLGADDYAKHEDAVPRRVLQLLGDLPEEEKFAKRLPATYLLAAQANYKLGNSEKAQKYAETFLKLVPNSTVANKLWESLKSQHATR
jgi:spermidine synthase